MQIVEIRKLNLKGSILDVGSKKSISNVTNQLNTEEKINYADKFSKDPNDLIIDLEEVREFKDKTFKNVLLFNVLEHVYNFKNCCMVSLVYFLSLISVGNLKSKSINIGE